ncbi:MAG: DUF2997 domain-containing protein [Treponema sp.]|nr:DUF2997 domain-containing protein [Treponema sp.]
MAKKDELEISITAEGDVSINVIGAKGKKCLDLTKDLEEVLGIVAERETKPQFYEQDIENSNYINTGLN